MYKKIRCPKCQFEFKKWIHSLKTDKNKPSEVKTMERKKPYKFTGKYAVGSQWDARERKIYKDADGKFVFYKNRRIRDW